MQPREEGGLGMTVSPDKKHIGMDEAVAGLKALVAEFGPDTKRACRYLEYTYSNYDDDGIPEETAVAPHCIIGHFLYRNGVPLSELQGIEGETVGVSVHLDEIELTEDAAAILGAAQRAQDAGEPWGEAVRYAEEEAEWIKQVSNGRYDLS